MTAFSAELRKAKRRRDGWIVGLAPLAVLLWCVYSRPDGVEEAGYSALLYSIPIMNAVVMPVAMAMLGSRLWDVELRGNMPKLLYTLQSRRSLYAAKAALGAVQVIAVAALEAALVPLLGAAAGYRQALPIGELLWLFACTAAVNGMLLSSELLLTAALNGPIPALCVGIAGALLALFSAFLPRKFSLLIPWGYYIPLSAYSLLWNREAGSVRYVLGEHSVWLLAWVILLGAGLAAWA